MQSQTDTRVYNIDYDHGPLKDIKEEEITDFQASSSRIHNLGSHKDSMGSAGSMRSNTSGSTPDYDILEKEHFNKSRHVDHDATSLTSLQEFEHLESTVAAENSRRFQRGSHDCVNNSGFPRRYTTGRSGHGDDTSLKDFEGLEKACRENRLMELRAREEEELLEYESPEDKYKAENLPHSRISGATNSFNLSTSESGDYEKRIKEIDETIWITQSNVEKLD